MRKSRFTESQIVAILNSRDLHCNVGRRTIALRHPGQTAGKANRSGRGSADQSRSQAACSAAKVADLGSRLGANGTHQIYRRHRREGLLLRSLQSMATRKQRKHQWTAQAILPEGDGSLGCQPGPTGCCGKETKYSTSRDPRLENSSLYSRIKCFDDPLRPSPTKVRK